MNCFVERFIIDQRLLIFRLEDHNILGNVTGIDFALSLSNSK